MQRIEHCDDGERVHSDVSANRADAIAERVARKLSDDVAAGVAERDVACDNRGVRCRAERDDASVTRLRRGDQHCEMTIVTWQHRDAAFFQTFEDLRLGLRDTFLAVGKIPDVNWQHVGDDGDVRARHPCQRADLTGVIHADLDHGEVDVRRHPRESQRHAPVIVEGLLRRVHFAGGRKTRAQHFLGAGLACAAGDGNDARLRPQSCACSDGDAFQCP